MHIPIPPDQLIRYRDDFEGKGNDNGARSWYARDLMHLLGYDNYETFKKAINKASQACVALNISIADNFQQVNREIDNETVTDLKLSRFACYLTAMNGDVRKPEVATMQAYFIGLAETMRRYIEDGENVDRLIMRDELTEQVNVMTHVAKAYGVKDYGLFQNAGYRGMYNMNLKELRFHKGVKQDQTLFDYMGSTELAANLFRITQTSEKIRNENLKGQISLEGAAEHVGKIVRRTMKETSGTLPENLRISENIKDVKRGLKSAHKEFKKLDKRGKKSK
jgi:DNA-damage-inducible protein D